jgi:PhnB protein
MAFHPYLYFGGNCREAFTRYHEIFGGELTIMDYHDAPPGSVPPDKMHLVMHASLNIGDESLMASDSYGDDFDPTSATHVHFSTADLEQAKAVFDQLSDGGIVTMPGEEQFWTPFYGMVIDRFGIPWQVNAEAPADDG